MTRHPKPATAMVVTFALFALLAVAAYAAPQAAASRSQWSIFEEQRYLIDTDPATREATLNDIGSLGADTVRVLLSWGAVAPEASAKDRPSFDATDPAAYPGFGNYDDLIARATAKGLRVMITIAGPVPVWATRGGRGNNYRPSASEFSRFVEALGRRYSGGFANLPKVSRWSFWNEPNHPQFLTPQRSRNSPSARSYRDLVAVGIPALRSSGHRDSIILVGELAPFPPAKGPGPLGFLRTWLCLDSSYKRLRGSMARRRGCRGFKRIRADGFAIHAYTRPVSKYKPKGDAVTIAVIRRLARALDRAARARRLPRRLPIYNTEFGIQTNPPDPYQGGSLSKQSQILNESEEFSYRYPRLKSYSQYLMYDDPPFSEGPRFDRYRGFQSGLRFDDGRKKPAYDAYKFPLVVFRRGSGVRIWGRVRPGSGKRSLQLQVKRGSSYVDSGGPVSTDSRGYFRVNRSKRARYRFEALNDSGDVLGASRTARPIRQ